ncbi:DUF4044 domain-containing protein [Lacticaseibacillus brantae]|nr:DUF4044 domain-containing protein [Lacticaseibacillus brantae]
MKKKDSTFTKITKFFIWFMLIVTLLGSLVGTLSALHVI